MVDNNQEVLAEEPTQALESAVVVPSPPEQV